MSKKKRQNSVVDEKLPASKTVSKFPVKLVFGGFVLLLIVAAVVYFYKSSPKRTSRPVGAANGCQTIPPFVKTLGFGNQAALSTSDRMLKGLVVTDGSRKYQHPTWKSAGSLAPIQRDAKGNVYAAPAPMIDVLQNKPDEQNRVYKIDGQTQEMKLFAELPKASAPTAENSFGVLGLAYDCGTNSLYASSVSGSTRQNEVGRIYQINAADGNVISQIEKTDAIGLGVFNSAKGKKLYFGTARTSEIWSIDLADDGKFAGDARREISLENLGTRGGDKARRISFSQNEMTVFGVEFSFNLVAPSEKQETVYRFRYDAAKDAWTYLEEPPPEVGSGSQ